MSQIDFSKLKALVVEDNEFVRLTIRSHLNRLGIKDVSEAADGTAGLALLQEQQPSFVICDIAMEPMNGFDFLQAVRAMDNSLRNLPIVFLTGAADEKNVRRAIAGGVNGYLLKPVMADDLRQVIVALLKKMWGA